VKIRSDKKIGGLRQWLCFLLLSFLFGSLVALLSGSLQIKENVHAGVPLDEFKAHMDKHIPILMRKYGIPGCSISLVKHGEIAASEAYGYADVENHRLLTVDTPMSVQSITKSLTAWGIMKLVEDGSLDLDAPVSQYLKNWQFPQTKYTVAKVTVRSLLSHTAGLPLGDFTNTYAPGEKMPSLLEKLTKEAVLIHEPGTKFSYSNVGYHLLELLIEEVTGQRFAEYMISEVLLPIGMGASTFEISRSMQHYPPTGYDLNGKPVPVYVYPEKSSGGLFATAEDIAQFAIAGMKENSVLNFEHVQVMYAPERYKIGIYGMVFDAYGLGHYIEILPNGSLSISHGGQCNGIMTHFQVVPETEDAIVILTNSQRSWPFIANLLSDWAQWRNFPSVGMGRIIWGQYAMSGFTGVLFAASLVIMLNYFLGYRQQKSTVLKIFKIFTAILLIGIIIWSINQKYLFITSVFPVLSLWLGGAVVVLSITLLSSSLLPKTLKRKEGVARRK